MTSFALRCRVCETPFAPEPLAACPGCDGPLDVAYEWERRQVGRGELAARPASMWRYAEVLPHVGDGGPGHTPLVPAPRLSETVGVEVLLKLETANPTHSFKDRLAASAVAAAEAFGLGVVTCAPGGRLTEAVTARAALRGLRSVVVARGPGSVAAELAPFAVEGAKTVALEIVEQLGWRFPDAVVAPLASGTLFAKLAQGFAEAALLSLAGGERPRLIGAQAGGCPPLAAAFAEQRRPSRVTPRTAARALAVGDPTFGDLALGAARMTGGAIRAVAESEIRPLSALLAATTGVFADSAAGVALGALRDSVRDGLVEPGARVVLVVTGTAAAAAHPRHAAAAAYLN